MDPVDSGAGTNSGCKMKRAKEEKTVKRSKKATSDAALGAKRRKETGTFNGEPEEKEESVGKNDDKKDTKQSMGKLHQRGCSTENGEGSTLVKGEDSGDACHAANELAWEEGIIPASEDIEGYSHGLFTEMTVEFTDSPSSSQKKPPRRISAKDKELAELVHKVHLLCLLARGRIVDNACNDPLIQASLLSLLPANLPVIGDIEKLTANRLCSLVNWFRNNFRVKNQNIDRGSFHANLAFTLQTREGTAEEVAALSVALFRALNLTTRFVSVLDATSLKPDADTSGIPKKDTESMDMRVSSASTSLLTTHQRNVPSDIHLQGMTNKNQVISTADKLEEGHSPACKKDLHEVLAFGCSFNDEGDSTATRKACNDKSDTIDKNLAEVSERKGDVEFMLELERAISATAAVTGNKEHPQNDQLSNCPSTQTSSMGKLKQSNAVGSSVSLHCSSGAVWSRRAGPPLYWAEVYCSGETLTGRWVHVDAANAIIDGAEKVEAAAAACRRPLKYVVAFAGCGAKDVTRRYCMHWYKIASKRINSQWWESVLDPLKELESAASGSSVQLKQLEGKSSSELEMKTINSIDMNIRDSSQSRLESENHADELSRNGSKAAKSVDPEASSVCLASASRDSLEDMELATRALTEPLPTNQLAYRNHHLYAIEKWLNRNQVLHPKGPILGYCSGHPVYPRSCVKTLQTKQKWLREGLQVRAGEIPAKVLKRSKNIANDQTSELDGFTEDCGQISTELFGKWQLEPLKLPHAVNGVVPKNERGQVEVWSEKCLPPGTVHLRLPRLVPVAKRLEIDFAPAMVGFDFRNGRCVPMFEGIVVCAEFKNAILEAYAEEEERREFEERKRNENLALSRWLQLLSSIITRQRLKNTYLDSSSIHETSLSEQKKNDRCAPQKASSPRNMPSSSQHPDRPGEVLRPSLSSGHDHVHIFPVENQRLDEETLVLTKRCPCGFSIEVEEL